MQPFTHTQTAIRTLSGNEVHIDSMGGCCKTWTVQPGTEPFCLGVVLSDFRLVFFFLVGGGGQNNEISVIMKCFGAGQNHMRALTRN